MRENLLVLVAVILFVSGLIYLVSTNFSCFRSNYVKPPGKIPMTYQNGGKCQFLHNPKTAGSAIKQHIEKNLSQCVIYNMHEEFPENNRITLMRDPYERLKSAIKYVQKAGHRGEYPYTSPQHEACYRLITSTNSFSDLLNTGRFEELCDFDVVFKPQKPYTDNSEILCYEDIDQFNDFVKDNCGCSTEDPLEPVNTTKKDDSYFDDEDLFMVFATDKYAEDIRKYQETCGK